MNDKNSNDSRMEKLALQAKEITDTAMLEGKQTMALEMMGRHMRGKYQYGPDEIKDIMQSAERAITTALGKFALGMMMTQMQFAAEKQTATGDPKKFEDLMAKFGGLGDIGDERDIAKN